LEIQKRLTGIQNNAIGLFNLGDFKATAPLGNAVKHFVLDIWRQSRIV